MYQHCMAEQNFDYVDESICLILKHYFNSIVTFIALYLVPLISSNYVVVGSLTKPEKAQIPIIHSLAELFVTA